MPSSSPWRRSTSWQPGDAAVERRCATSKKAALQSVTRAVERQQVGGHGAGGRARRWQRSRISTAVRVQTDQWPSRPPTKRSSPASVPERHGQVEHDVVVVAGVERDPSWRPPLGDAVDDVERPVAVERRDLDRRRRSRSAAKPPPERCATARRRRPPAAGRSRPRATRSATARQWAISASSFAPWSAARLRSTAW